MTAALRSFRRRRLSATEAQTQANRVLATPRAERLENAPDLHLDDPELLLSLFGTLAKQCDSAPAAVLEETEFFYEYLEALEVRYPADPILCDEREYFLGEAARIAGTASRILSKREDARNWFDLAEAWFLTTENAPANIARLAYQRLALRIEERDFPGVLRLVPHLVANLERLGMPEDAVKARFLLAVVLKESGRLEESVQVFDEIVERCRTIRNDVLLGWAVMNLAQTHALLQDPDKAMAAAAEATPLLRRQGNHVGLGKLQMAVGLLLRSTGSFADAIDAFRSAQREFSEIALHADVAAVHLIVADLLLEVSQPAQAEWEVRAALPIIDEYKLVPEGIAALSLLRDSLRRRQIDRNALRGLHGYFSDRAAS